MLLLTMFPSRSILLMRKKSAFKIKFVFPGSKHEDRTVQLTGSTEQFLNMAIILSGKWLVQPAGINSAIFYKMN